MHILLIHQAFTTLDEPGGTRHHELARGLAAAGHRVTVIASPVSYLTGRSGSGQAETEPGITVLRASTYAALHKSFAHRVVAFFSFMLSSFWLGLRVPGVDLVWGTSPPIFQGATALAQRLIVALKRVSAEHGAPAPPAVRAGLDGVPDFGDTAVDPAELLRRANAALQSAVPGPDTWLKRFVH